MVSFGTAVRIGMLLWLWLVVSTASAAPLQITTLSNEIELGKPLWVMMTSDQTKVPLNTIDFSPWQQDFVLPRQYDLNIAENKRSQHLRMQLFPLHKGVLKLPPLSFLNQHSNEISIDVREARDAKSHAPIDFAYKVSTDTPWQQQQVIVAVTITTRDAYVVFTQPTERVNGTQLLPMQIQQHEVHETLDPQTRYQLGWVLIPSRAGAMHVQLPPVQYVRDGVVTHQFYIPPLELKVQPLPAWLPGTIPVGTLKVINYQLPQMWLSTSVLSHVQLQLQLTGMAADAIPDFAQQLRSDSAVQYYSAQQNRVTTVDSHGIQQQLQYDIPLVAKHLGIYHLPDLRMQYFDPASGTLKAQQVRGASIVIVNTWVKSLLLVCMLILVGWLLRVWIRWLARVWRRYQTYRQALQQLPQSNSLPAIRQVMQTMAEAEGWPTNLTYRQWQARMQEVAPMAQQLAVPDLNGASYGQGKIKIKPVVQLLTRISRQRRFALR